MDAPAVRPRLGLDRNPRRLDDQHGPLGTANEIPRDTPEKRSAYGAAPREPTTTRSASCLSAMDKMPSTVGAEILSSV